MNTTDGMGPKGICIAPLFVPGDRPERFGKAANSGADAVIIDLEDAVAPAAKAEARDALRVDFTALPVYVRVNGAGTAWHEDDLAAVARLSVAGIMLPKAEAGATLQRIAESEAAHHSIIALVESARGLASVRDLAASPQVIRLAFGSLDFSADLGCAHTRDALLSARSELVLASRLASLEPALDGVTAVIADAAAAEDDARYAAGLGFGGKLCIHPSQVSAVVRGFQPSADEIAWALEVAAAGAGVSTVKGRMVDQPMKLRAQTILSWRRGR